MPETKAPVKETETQTEIETQKETSKIEEAEKTPEVIEVAERRGEGIAIKVLLTIVIILLIASAVAFGGYIFLHSDSKALKLIENFSISDLLGPTTPKNDAVPKAETGAPTADKTILPSMMLLSEKVQTTVNVNPEPAAELTTEQIALNVMPSVVGIESFDENNTLKGVGVGSGIIMSADGYIITNAHVIMEQDELTVQKNFRVHLSDETICDGVFVGADRKTDLAVIKIDKTGLKPADFGNSDELVVGSKAVAIGNPTGLQLSGSLTQGVISGLNREVNIGFTGDPMACVQTDAPINPGNSGGALINKSGQVIGVNTIKVSATVYEGLGFAIPINTAKPIIDELIESGSIKSRPRLGITITTVPSGFADKVKITQGVRVVMLDEVSDAKKAGLKKGDIITTADGMEITAKEEFTGYVRTKKIGETIKLTVLTMQDDKMKSVEIDVKVIEDNSGNVK